MTTNQKLTKNYSGIFGHQVVLKNRRGQIVMTIPQVKPKLVPSEKQVAVRERLKLAVTYAKNVLNDPALHALYAAKASKSLPPYRLAMHDYLRPPYIHQVDKSGYHGIIGEKIIVSAGDDFQLASVTVRISNPDGTLVEEGGCVFNMPILIVHFNLLTINKVRWSDYSGEDWSKRAFFPIDLISDRSRYYIAFPFIKVLKGVMIIRFASLKCTGTTKPIH